MCCWRWGNFAKTLLIHALEFPRRWPTHEYESTGNDLHDWIIDRANDDADRMHDTVINRLGHARSIDCQSAEPNKKGSCREKQQQ